MRRAGAFGIWLLVLTGCAPAGSADAMRGVEADARLFMAGYAADMQNQDRQALAARYNRQGAFWMLHGQKRFVVHDSIVDYFEEQWAPPDDFRWDDVSYEVLGDAAVVVIGIMRFNDPDGSISEATNE